MLDELLVSDIYLFMMIFARLGSALILLPGFGEVNVPVRVRLIIALAFSFVVFPVVSVALPTLPENLAELIFLLVGETLIGIAIGAITRLLLSMLQVGGTIIAFNAGLASAQLFDPSAGQTGAITGAFLATIGITLLFVTNMHHVMLMAMVDSYVLFIPGQGFPVGDFSESVTRIVSDSFRLGLQIALPVLVVSFRLRHSTKRWSPTAATAGSRYLRATMSSSRFRIAALVFPRKILSTFSSHSSPPKKSVPGPGWGFRPSTVSSSRPAAMFWWILFRDRAQHSRSCCRPTPQKRVRSGKLKQLMRPRLPRRSVPARSLLWKMRMRFAYSRRVLYAPKATRFSKHALVKQPWN